MSRAGYCDDLDSEWAMICWRGAVASAIRGRRGQAFLREMLVALDELKERRLIAGSLQNEAGVCAIGAIGARRGIDLSALDPYDHDALAAAFGVAQALTREVEYFNDMYHKSDEDRYTFMRQWVEAQLQRTKSI